MLHRASAVLLAMVCAAACSVVAAPIGLANGCITPAAGTAEDPYLIETEGNLACLQHNPADYWTGGKHFLQTADITLTGTSIPIGSSTTPFTGTYDGGGYRISGLSIIDPNGVWAGLFGSIHDSTIRRVTIDGSVTGQAYVGGLVGEAVDSTIEDSSSAVTVVGSVMASCGAGGPYGGLVGYLVRGILRSSSASGAVGATPGAGCLTVGGLAGESNASSVSTSYATGAVSGDVNVGGLFGFLRGGTLERSFASGSVTAVSNAGGLIGGTDGSGIEVSDTYARGSVSLTAGGPGGAWGATNLSGRYANSYATGALTGSGQFGGLVGSSTGTWSASFWDTTSTGVSSATYAGAQSGMSGAVTSALTSLDTFRSAGWSISNVIGSGATWGICPSVNDGYPFLHALTATNPCAIVVEDATPSPPPPPWRQAFARASDDTCPTGWNPSWAQWPNDGTGGFVCQRTLVYNQSTGQWDVRRLSSTLV